ncbi:MAG: hypothetical protein HYR96_08375 [Deltaproteobacteria bacterium]|nr:hypothetical protein [Deltaproteobacteria bacterium]
MLSPGYLPTIPSLLRSSRSPLIHRDLSWLQFNERVLDEARATGNPILERVKFLAITSSNLDEFFMIRVPSLERSLLYRLRGLDVQKARQIRRIRNSILESVSKFGAKQEETLDSLINELAQYQIILSHMNPWRDEAVELGRKIFQEKILPYLSIPETFRPSDVLTLDNAQAGAVFSERLWMKIPRTLPTLYFEDLGPDRPFYAFFLDDLLIRFLPESFSTQLELGLIRLTRDGDVALDVDHPDPESIPDHIVTRLGTRERGRPIRIQYSRGVSSKLAASLLEVTKLARPFAFQAPGTLYLHGLWSLVRQVPDRIARAHSTIQYPPLDSRVPRVFEDSSTIFEKIRGRDYLLHHPYDSFDAFVNWMKVASEDPHVVNIELTVYRMDALSPVITHLKNAAATKRVRVLIELRARFDELNNIRLADELRKAGVEVGYGFGKLKLHAKVALVTRKEKDGLVAPARRPHPPLAPSPISHSAGGRGRRSRREGPHRCEGERSGRRRDRAEPL